MGTIVLKPLYHRDRENIAIEVPKQGEINLAVKKLKGVKWSQTHRVWYMPWGKESYSAIIEALKPLATIDNRPLLAYLEKRAIVRSAQVPPGNPAEKLPVAKPSFQRKLPAESAAWQLSKENLQALDRYVQEMKLRGREESTIRTYRGEFMQLLKWLQNRAVYELLPDDIRGYMVYAMEKEGISANTAHSRLNAIKFYFEQVLKREKFFWEIPRPKKPYILPNVNSEAAMTRLFNAATKLKHKAILFTAYSAGLRVSEVVRLQWKHLDRERCQMLIKSAKGDKDRYVPLSPLVADILTSYYRKSVVKPRTYVFEGKTPGMPYSRRSAQAVFKQAKEKAGIRKDVSFHSLRHSFATHLLEKGIDVKYIQELLGHFSIKTTTRYLHIAKEKLVVIESPLDSLWKEGGIDWDG
jgi:integrase/recombinase XerD